MYKTGQQIENDVLDLFDNSEIASEIGGDVYNYGMRPTGSQEEDAVVRFIAGQNCGEQSGTVKVSVYVPDVDLYDDGVFRKDIDRCAELEASVSEWISSLTPNRSDYMFSLNHTICTKEDTGAGQHYVDVRINYTLNTI